MAKYTLCALAILMLMSCNKDRKLTLSDLKFPTADEAVRSNNIDTTFMVSGEPGSSAGGPDTIGMIVYDTLGRIIADRSNLRESFEYGYDVFGDISYKVHRDHDISYRLNAAGDFNVDSTLLTKQWLDSANVCRYITISRFNAKGWLAKETKENKDSLDKWSYVRELMYTQDAKLKGEKLTEKYNGGVTSQKLTRFYYSPANKLDSVITHDRSGMGTLRIVHYYNDLGLRTRTVEHDSVMRTIQYIHHKRGGL